MGTGEDAAGFIFCLSLIIEFIKLTGAGPHLKAHPYELSCALKYWCSQRFVFAGIEMHSGILLVS